MKIFLFIIVLVYILIILINQNFVNAIKITNISYVGFNTKHIIPNLISFLNATSLCIISESGEILCGLLELFKHDYKPVVIIEDLSKPLLTCVFILVRNDYKVRDCGSSILDSHQTSVVYVSRDSVTLPRGLSEAQSQDVFALSLSNSSLFQLSPVFPQPRHFVRTSLTEVLQRRAEKSKKLDLQGSALSIGALRYIPIFIYVESNSTSKALCVVPDEHDGVYAQLVEEMAQYFNFSYSYIFYTYYGTALDNGTWEVGGLGHVIQEGRVDVIATGVWQVPEFYNLMDFGPAINKGKLAFMVLRPELIDFQWHIVVDIFKPKVWFAILGSFALTVLVYWAGVNWGPHPCTESWSGCILTMFGYFTSSTSHKRVDEGNTRFTLTSWSVFSLLITTSLSTGIVTRLTIPSYSPRIDSVEQLVESKYFWTVQFYADFKNNTLLRETLFNLENQWVQKFEKRYVYKDPEEIEKTAGTDKRMAYVTQLYGNDLVALETEGLDGHPALKNYRVSKEVFTEALVSFGVKKQSVLLEPLTGFTLLLLQAGLMTHWMDDVYRRWPKLDYRHLLIEQDIPTFGEPHGLPLYKVQPVFLLLVFGLSLSSFVFFIEICW